MRCSTVFPFRPAAEAEMRSVASAKSYRHPWEFAVKVGALWVEALQAHEMEYPRSFRHRWTRHRPVGTAAWVAAAVGLGAGRAAAVAAAVVDRTRWPNERWNPQRGTASAAFSRFHPNWE